MPGTVRSSWIETDRDRHHSTNETSYIFELQWAGGAFYFDDAARVWYVCVYYQPPHRPVNPYVFMGRTRCGSPAYPLEDHYPRRVPYLISSEPKLSSAQLSSAQIHHRPIDTRTRASIPTYLCKIVSTFARSRLYSILPLRYLLPI